jgi:hypothetical protein
VYLGREGAAAWIAWCLLRRDEVVLGEYEGKRRVGFEKHPDGALGSLKLRQSFLHSFEITYCERGNSKS